MEKELFSLRPAHLRVGAAVGALGVAVAYGATTTAASAAPAKSAAAPITRLTLTDSKIVGLPKSFAPGWHTFVLTQKAKDRRELSFSQAHAGVSAATVKKDFAAGLLPLFEGKVSGKALSAYKKLIKEDTFIGGIALLGSGSESSTFTVKFVPGAVVVDDGAYDEGPDKTVTVPVTSGPSVGSAPKTKGSITTHQYGFITQGLTAGKKTYAIHNGGTQLHFIDISYIEPGHSDQEVTDLFNSDANPPSWVHDVAYSDVQSPGQTTDITLNLKAGGHYLFVCFMPDTSTGAPHAFMGMVKQVHIPS
jgi:hypothetical protein